MKNLSILLIFIGILASCQNQQDVPDYPGADAVYLKLEKTYTLNKDGSMEYAFYKEHLLLSHRAFHSLYGQTDIYYNPEHDSVIIEVAETETPDGRTVPVPENGFVDMIPGYARGAAHLSHLKHRAVVHTALERGAIIKSGYRVITKPGTFPNLAAREIISNDCPVQSYTLKVRVPKNEQFNYRSFNQAAQPEIKNKGGFTEYTWEINHVDMRSPEPMGLRDDQASTQILFSTGEYFNTFNEITSQRAFTFETSIGMREAIADRVNRIKDSFRKLGVLQKIVVEEIQNHPVPLTQVGYHIRPAIQTWESMSGSPEEKAILLTAAVRSLGMDAVPVAFVPQYLFTKDSLTDPLGPIDLLSFNHVEVTLGQDKVYLDVNQIHTVDPVLRHARHLIVPLEMGYSQVNLTQVSAVENQLSWDGTISLYENNRMLSGSFEGNYIGRINPFLGLKLYPEKLAGLYPGYGIIEVSSTRSTLISYERIFEDYIQVISDKWMFDLPLNTSGFDSWGITYLPDERTTKLQLPSKIREFQRIEMELPEGFTTIGFDKDITRTNDLGRVSIRYNTMNGTVSVMRNININKEVILPAEYRLFKQLVDPWINPDHKKIILQKK